MSVQNTNSQYANMVDVWRKIDDVCGGSREVKAKRTIYLPMINSCDNSDENIARYNAYLTRAVFYPIAKDTVQNNVGLAFSEDPTFEPDGLDFLKTDADGSGVSIYQLNQIALKGLIKHARGGFFVDYPSTEGGATKADVMLRGIRPTIIYYSALNIINWRVKKIGGVFKTSLVVLLEVTTQQDPLDEFSEIQVQNYRVLRLDDNNEYCVQVYSDASGNLVGGDPVYPLNAKNQRWTEIPFIPVGSQSNDFLQDEIPIEPVVEINLAHYRNSAEYEQSLFYTSQVQPIFFNIDEQQAKEMKEEGVKLGSATPLVLYGQGADFKYEQPSETSAAKEGMDDKLNYMQILGAKVIETNTAIKTATQSDNEMMTKNSVLSLCVSNLNEASEYYLRWCAEYYGSGFKAKFSIKQDFAKGKIGLEDLKYWQSEYVAGNISAETYHEIKATGKVPEVSFKEEQLRIEKQRDGNVVE